VLRSSAIRLQLPLDAVWIIRAIQNELPKVGMKIVLFWILGNEPITCIVFSSDKSISCRGILILRKSTRWVLRHLIFKREIKRCILSGVLSSFVILLFIRLFVQLFAYWFTIDHLWDIIWSQHLLLFRLDAEFFWVEWISRVSWDVNLAVNLLFFQHGLALRVSYVELIFLFFSYLYTNWFLSN